MGILKKKFSFTLRTQTRTKMNKVRAHQLRKYEEAKLVEELTGHRKELAALRVSKVSQQQVKLTKIRSVRKNIAKVLTALSEKRIQAARDEFKKKRYTPVDLRQKKNRAFRRRLTPFEAKKQTTRGAKKAATTKVRKYALAA